ncbi:MAG: hypothetical protein LBR40_01845 [Bacilli bacterium]|jgi:uncharacterized membrane protein YiaA|nr:hypothetical protein [Bacilli bacterium]
MDVKKKRIVLLITLLFVIIGNVVVWIFNLPLVPSLAIIYVIAFGVLRWASKQ